MHVYLLGVLLFIMTLQLYNDNRGLYRILLILQLYTFKQLKVLSPQVAGKYIQVCNKVTRGQGPSFQRGAPVPTCDKGTSDCIVIFEIKKVRR